MQRTLTSLAESSSSFLHVSRTSSRCRMIRRLCLALVVVVLSAALGCDAPNPMEGECVRAPDSADAAVEAVMQHDGAEGYSADQFRVEGSRAVGEPCSANDQCANNFCFNGACREEAPMGPTTRQLLIVDNFYTDVWDVRNWILNHAVFEQQGNYPGLRTRPYVTESAKAALQAHLGRNFTYFPTQSDNGAYQYTLAHHKSWIHADNTQWAALVFLTPNAPANGGTRFYRHKATRLTERPTQADAVRLGFNSSEELLQYVYRDSQNYDAWEKTDEVANVFNRLIMFRGFRFHQSADYFGTCLRTGRLFQTFFFDTN